MAVEQFTYQQLDNVLNRLGFRLRYTTDPKNRKWRCYEHADSQTEIILMDQKPAETVRAADALSARRHLVEKGLVSDEDLDRMLLRPTKHLPAGRKT